MAGVTWWDWYGDASLLVVDVGLACCALEFEAAVLGGRRDPEAGRGAARPRALPRPPVSLPAGARVAVVVSGTVTDRLAPAVVAIIDAAGRLGAPVTVVAFGACASSGGPYWDSYAVTKGVDQLVPVGVFVPGCPPPPAALESVLASLRTGAAA